MSAAETSFADGLRALADWIDANPGVVDVPEVTLNVPFFDREEFTEAVKALGGHREKIAHDSYFVVRRTFGEGVQLDVYMPREQVCRKVVLGTREVPERVVPARTEEIVEWVCDDSLLASVAEEVAS